MSSTTLGINVDAALRARIPEYVPPFLAFAQSIAPQSVLQSAITSAYRRAETECLPLLITQADLGELKPAVTDLARQLVTALRQKRLGSGVDGLIHEYSLSSQEGIALMCLAEALLRIPDNATRDALIRDKVSKGDWQSHMNSGSVFVNAATWGLMITGKLVSTNSERGMSSALTRMISKGGEPLIRKGVDRAMRLMGEHFVCGETIDSALANGRRWVNKGFTYSYDMLGEAAMTDADALSYYAAYEQAIHAIGKSAEGLGMYQGPGISIKLSALHARYSRAQQERVMTELYPRLLQLAVLAREYDIGLNIDAEEADRLELSLALLERLCLEPALAGWRGIGFVVQAYQKRAPYVLEYLIDLARRTHHRLMVRLVKGAYWDTEIKRAQVDGLEGYPVFTRKIHTDVSYLACARQLLAAPDAVFPQFATHNAHTVAAIYHMAGPNFYAEQYEFQCLHGMGEPLYEEVVGAVSVAKLGRPCRIYAPVGSHETLLAYLVRRLLENGANSSFVNRIADDSVTIDELIADPVEQSRAVQPLGAPHPLIPLPVDLYLHQNENRRNSHGLDLSNEHRLVSLSEGLLASTVHTWQAIPATYEAAKSSSERSQFVLNPADHRDVVGQVVFSQSAEVELALSRADLAAPIWAATSATERASCLLRGADLLETNTPELIALTVREAGKSYSNAIAEIREAVDFLRYYARHAQQLDVDTYRPLGPVTCISPWNFPLAIFLGQISAALAAGNVVLAKPAEQTSLIAQQGVRLLHEAGVPKEALQLLPGAGEVGAALVQDVRTQGVMFTGSTDVAQLIAKQLAGRLNKAGQPIPLVAETGGLNVMVVDSSALAEQVVADVIHSAFDSAGQRCSALRILCLQDEIADPMLTMLRGAMKELSVANPDQLSTDVGPVIDQEAQQNIQRHIAQMHQQGFAIEQIAVEPACTQGTFVAPTLIEITHISDVKQEVFGPVLHVLRYRRAEVDALIQDVNASGYGLTFGVHSRIDESIDNWVQHVRVGNQYVNRNIVGAVVGVQPFGGQGLSGTGPKAGGPLYIPRLQDFEPTRLSLGDKAKFSTAPLASSFLNWIRAVQPAQLVQQIQSIFELSLYGAQLVLPGPTGELNNYHLLPRGQVLCLPKTERGAYLQLASCIATGNTAVFVVGIEAQWLASWLQALPDDVGPQVIQVAHLEQALQSLSVGAALFEGDGDELMALAHDLAEYSAVIIQPQGRTVAELKEGKTYRLERLLIERSLSVNTAAAGGNATLMAMI